MTVLWSTEYLLFAALAVTGAAFLAFRLARLGNWRQLQALNLALAGGLLVFGALRMQQAERQGLLRLSSMLEGFAPTYANELEALGHARLALDAAPDDPLYLSLIEAQKRWLAANPAAADIYTYRRRPDGTVVLMVDSETDHDRDGRYEGEREQRTAIGKVYEEGDEALERAFAGEATFSTEIVVDPWGAWVSAQEPLRAPDGSVEAVLGVDYPAESWLAAARRQRRAQLGWMSTLLLLAQSSLFVITILLPHLRERRRAEQELALAVRRAEESSRSKSTFLTTVSHELRTPLNAILGMGELLRDTGLRNEQRELLEVMVASGHSLKAQIDDLLAISQAGQICIRCELQPFDPAQVTRETCARHAEMARAKGLDFRLEIAAEVPARVRGDGARFGQLIGHLLSNAVKFTAQGGVSVVLRPEVDEGTSVLLALEVRDTGIGFEEGQIEEMFRSFTQLDSSYSRRYGGAGLGLALVKEISAAMRGEITCTGKLGEGSSFVLRVPFEKTMDPVRAPLVPVIAARGEHPGEPAIAHSEPPAALPHPDRSTEPSSSRPTALVVDDVPASRTLLERLLGGQGWSCESAANGPQALEHFQARQFDVVLLDLAMPGMDGLEVLERMRAMEQRGSRRTPVFAVTAVEMSDQRHRLNSADFDAWIEKPVDVRALTARLQELLSTRPRAS